MIKDPCMENVQFQKIYVKELYYIVILKPCATKLKDWKIFSLGKDFLFKFILMGCVTSSMILPSLKKLYIQLLNKPYLNEANLGEQNLPLKCWNKCDGGLDLSMYATYGLKGQRAAKL